MHAKRLLTVIALSAALVWAVSLINRPAQAAPAYRPVAGPPWNDNVRVNDTTSAVTATRIAPAFTARDSSSVVYAVWQDARNDDGDIYSAQSANGGQTWSFITRVNRDTPGTLQADPDVAISAAGTLHAVWEDNGLSYARSIDSGRSWGTTSQINGVGTLGVDPAIAVYTNTVCAAWVDGTGVRVDCSSDNGVNWGATDLTAPAVDGQTPDLVVDNLGQVHVVWSDTRNGPRDIYYARFAGKTWSTATKLNTDAGSAVQLYPSIAISGSALMVGWQDNRSGTQVYARYSSNLGSTWSASDAQVSDAGNVIGAPALTAGRSALWATWLVLSGSNYIAYADTGTSTWGTDAAITTTAQPRQDIAATGNLTNVWSAWSQNDAIWNATRTTSWGNAYQTSNAGEALQLYAALGVANNGDLFAAWNDNRSNPGLYTAKSTDGGITWGTNNFVSGSTDSGQPALAVTGTQALHVAWRQEDYNYWRIYYNRSVDGGSTWLTATAMMSVMQVHRPQIAGSSPNEESPDVAVLGNNVFMSWAAEGALYLAKSTDGGSTWGTPTNVFTMVNTTTVMATGKVAIRAYSSSLLGDRVILAWTNSYARTCAAFSSNGGSTWPDRICFNAGSATTAQSPAIALRPDGGSAVVVWHDNRDGTQHLYRAIWSGTTLVRDSGLITEATGPVAFPTAFTTYEGVTTVVHLAWQDSRNGDDDIYWSRSNDGGLNWQAAVRVNDDSTTLPQQRPILANNGAFSSTKVWAAWQDFRRNNWDIYATTITRTCDVPLTGVGISGPTSAWINQQVVLASIITPSNASTPIGYEWRNPPNPVQDTSTATYTWSTYGNQVVTLTASSCSAFSKVQTVQVKCTNPITAVSFAPLPNSVVAGTAFTVTAIITPALPDDPVNIVWTPEPEAGQGTLQARFRLSNLGSGHSLRTIQVNAKNCGGTWGGDVSYSDSLYVDDTQPPVFTNFSPSGWVTQTQGGYIVPFSVTAQDVGSGLMISSAVAYYTSDGATYGAAQALSVTGSYGSISPQIVAGQHDFGGESGTGHRNRVQIVITDTAGYVGGVYANIDLDITPPINPGSVTVRNLNSSVRLTNTWSASPTVQIDWSAASDGTYGSGVKDYLIVWTQNPTTVPDVGTAGVAIVNYPNQSTTRNIPGDGQNWYFHLRARDNAGLLAATTWHAGPYWLDTTAPTTPVKESSTPPTYSWTNATTLTVQWYASTDAGSGVSGYAYAWNGVQFTPPGSFPKPVFTNGGLVYTTGTPYPLDGNNYWFNVAACDNAGGQYGVPNCSSPLSVGPFRIDRQPPAMEGATPDQYPGSWTNDNTIVLAWQNIDPHTASAKDRYSYAWSTVSTTIPSSTPNLITNTVNLVLNQTIPDGSSQYFHLRTGDEAGNWSTSTFHLGPYKIDTIAPAAPVITYSSHVTNVWSSDDTIKVSWLKPIDTGSPIGAYSYVWDRATTTVPDTAPDFYSVNSVITTTSDPLPTAPDYYFHVRARDAAGNWGATTHLGPFKIDAPPPLLMVDHSSGGPGSDVMLTGLVFPADTGVTLLFTSTTGTSIVLGYTQTSFDGTFQVLATVPVTATENADYYFAATTLNKRARTPFHVSPGMSMAVQPDTVRVRIGNPSPTISVTLGNLNPDASVVIETDWNTFKGPYPLSGNTALNKSVTVPKTTISGTHTLTATSRVAGVAVQRAAATFSVTIQSVDFITDPAISLSIVHGVRGTALNFNGHNSWELVREPGDGSSDIYLCPPGYESDPTLAEWIAENGCPRFKGFEVQLGERTILTMEDTYDHDQDDYLEQYGSGYFEGKTHVPDHWFDARVEQERWPVEIEIPWGPTDVCLVGIIERWYWYWDSANLDPGQLPVQRQAPLSPEEYDIACTPFTVDPPTTTFSAQYKLISGTVPIPLNKSPRIIVDGRSVGARGSTPPTVMAAYTTTNVNTPISFTVPEGSYYVSAYACNFEPVLNQFTSGRGNQGLTSIHMTYTDLAGPAVKNLTADIQTLLSKDQPNRIGPLLSLKNIAGAPIVELPIIIEQPESEIAVVTSISATINGVQPVSVSPVSDNKRTAKWDASQLPAGELTLMVQLKGHYKSAQDSTCGTTESYGPVSQLTIVMAAPPPWLTGAHTNVTALSYDAATRVYHMAGKLKYGVDINKNADLGFLGTLQNYLLAATDVSQDFDLDTGAWNAQAIVRGGVSLMCLASLMGDCSEDYTLSLVAEPIGNTIRGAGDAAYPNQYTAATFNAYEYSIEPIEVYNGIIASYWGIVNVHLSINFGASAKLDITPGLQADFAPQVEFNPQATINAPINLWVDILLGAAAAGVEATPEVTLSMPVTLSPSGANVSGPFVCFRLTGRVWVEVLFWDASFGPFELYKTVECAQQLLKQALAATTPPPSTLPAPTLATDGYGHVLGAWVHNDSNNPDTNLGKLYTVYFDGANWGAQQAVAGNANLLVTDPAIAFAGEDRAVAVYATNAPNNTVPLTWTTITQQMSNQKLSYSIFNGTTWSSPATLATGGGPHGRVTLAGDPYRGRAIAMWVNDATGGSAVKKWKIMYAVYDAETDGWSTPAQVDDGMPANTLDAEVSLAFNSTGGATAIWVRQAGVESSSVITSPYTKNDLRTLVTANWHPNEPDVWVVTSQPTGLPTGALMPDIAFDDNDNPVVAYALHKQDRDTTTPTGLGNNAYLGYAVGTPSTIGYGPQAAQTFVWTAKTVPGVKGVEQPRVAMLPDDQALVTYRGFGAVGTADAAGVLMGNTIDLRDTGGYHASDAAALINGNSWMNDVIATRTRADGTGALEPRLFTVGAFNLGGQTAAVRMSGASMRQISLAGADPVMMSQAPIVPDLAVASADMILSETLPLSGTLVPYTITVRNLGLARTHQPIELELIQDPGSAHETVIATSTVPSDLMFNETYVLSGTWRAVSGVHVWLARVKPPLDDDIDGENNEAQIVVGMPSIPDQLVGHLDGRSAGLSWLPVTGAAMSGYHVYRAAGAGAWELLATTTQTAYADDTLQAGVAYRYAVSAVSTAGVGSALSDEVSLVLRAVYLPIVRR